MFSGIRQLQLILLKVSLLLGVEVHTGVEFRGLIEPSEENGIYTNQQSLFLIVNFSISSTVVFTNQQYLRTSIM